MVTQESCFELPRSGLHAFSDRDIVKASEVSCTKYLFKGSCEDRKGQVCVGLPSTFSSVFAKVTE
jgi:molybdopterin/thiamine biosynthesis adenylyltransferase